ncbi:hypothetical protein, partial [Moorena sp. SIO3B2]|uniref:hypothetical protein n=1 Tax=Moorena sp. SIO3B2 TaxID=2607827 RepID=UPI00257C5706
FVQRWPSFDETTNSSSLLYYCSSYSSDTSLNLTKRLSKRATPKLILVGQSRLFHNSPEESVGSVASVGKF